MSETEQEQPVAAESPATESPPAGRGLEGVLDVTLHATVEIGCAQLLVREFLQLDQGSVLELDRMTGDPADVRVNGKLVARGEVTVVEGRLAVKIVEVVGADGARA